MTSVDGEFVDFLLESMAVLGAVYAQRMFGGTGIFMDGLMIALVGDATLYLKSDAETDESFVAAGMEKFSYKKKDKTMQMSFYQAPEVVFDEQEQMIYWGEKAISAATRTAAKSRKKHFQP